MLLNKNIKLILKNINIGFLRKNLLKKIKFKILLI